MQSGQRDFGPEAVASALAQSAVEDAAHWAAMIEEEIKGLLPEEQSIRARELVHIAATGKPLAYVIGRQKFMGIDLIAEPGVIVPRPVTERVGRAALQLMERMHLVQPDRELLVVDMCSGSGNLACAIAFLDAGCRCWSCDLMPNASELARRNAAQVGVSDRVLVRTGDLFGAIEDEGLEHRVDIAVCAPPFISSGKLDRDRAYLLEHEPRQAFDAGPFGLNFHLSVAREAARFLRHGGFLVFEVGEGQSRQVSKILTRTGAYDEIAVVDEGDGKNLVVQGRRRQEE